MDNLPYSSPQATLPSHEVGGVEGVRHALQQVLASNEFHSSKRCRDFLRYVVESTLNNQGDTLKERTIAVDVFGRGSEYDPSDNATVRVRALEVRKRLDRYYSHEGAKSAIQILIPAGTYVPEFHRQPAASVGEQTETPAVDSSLTSAAPMAAKRKQLPVPLLGAALALVAAVLAVLGFWWHREVSQPVTPLTEFWSPVATTSSPTLLFGSVLPVYSLNHDPRSKDPVRVDEFVLVNDQYVGASDVNAIYQLSNFLGQMRRPYRIRIGHDISFNELRNQPAVLVGYTYTHWKEISSDLRYFIHVDGPPFGILDRDSVTPWVLSKLPNDPTLNEDYAIVSRVFHPDTHSMVVEIAGISHVGTEAAADLITNPEVFKDAIRDAPAGWQGKNLQIIIHVKTIRRNTLVAASRGIVFLVGIVAPSFRIGPPL